MFGGLIEGYLASMDRGCRDLPRGQDFTDNVRNVHLSGVFLLDLQGSHLPHLIPDFHECFPLLLGDRKYSR